MGTDRRTVFVFSTHDISTVQGTTEAFYVSKFFGEIFDTHVIGPLSSTIEGTTMHSYSASGLVGLLWVNMLLLPRWIWLAYKERPDIVYVYRNVLVPPVVLKLLFGTLVVCDLRVHPVEQPREFNSDTVLNRLSVRLAWVGHEFLLRFSNVTIALSEPLRRSLADSFSVEQDAIHVVPLGVDSDVFVPRNDDVTDEFAIAYVGPISPLRGIESVFEGLNELSEKSQRPITVELFGPAVEDYAAEIEKLASAGAYSVIWHGLIPHDDVPDRVGRCDCAISPLPPHDGFEVSSPAKVYEYLALGLPIIATTITPHQRILEHGRDSLFVEPGSSCQMAEAIEQLLVDEELRHELGTNARKKGIQNSWQSRIESIVEAIAEKTGAEVPDGF